MSTIKVQWKKERQPSGRNDYHAVINGTTYRLRSVGDDRRMYDVWIGDYDVASKGSLIAVAHLLRDAKAAAVAHTFRVEAS